MELRWYVDRWDKTVNDGREEVTVTEEPVLQYREESTRTDLHTDKPIEEPWRDVPTVYSDE